MPGLLKGTSIRRTVAMLRSLKKSQKRRCGLPAASFLVFLLGAGLAGGQQVAVRDPAEPAAGKPRARVIARPAGAIARASVDEKSMRALIHELVGCGTRLTLSSWTDPKRGVGCGRDVVVARFNKIAEDSGGKLHVMVDKFESTSER